jgi:hypothetical protein
MAMGMEVTMWLTALNVILTIALTVVYARNAIRIPSVFTAGLLLFAVLFLAQNAVALYFAVTMMPYLAPGLENYALAFAILQTLAFSILNVVTWR